MKIVTVKNSITYTLLGGAWDRMRKNGQSLSVRIDGKLGLLIDVFRPQWTLRRSGLIVMSRRFLGQDRTEGRDPPSPKQPLAQTGMMTMISTLHTLCPGLLTGNELNRIRSRAPIGGPYWIEIIASYVVQGSNSNLRSSVSQWMGGDSSSVRTSSTSCYFGDVKEQWKKGRAVSGWHVQQT